MAVCHWWNRKYGFWLPFGLTVAQWASLVEQELRLLVTIWFNSSTMAITGGAGSTASGYHFGLTVVQWASLVEQELRLLVTI